MLGSGASVAYGLPSMGDLAECIKSSDIVKCDPNYGAFCALLSSEGLEKAIDSVYLFDDHFTLLINASGKPISVEDIPLDDIEAAFEGESGTQEGCSTRDTPVPPNKKGTHSGAFFIWLRQGN